LNERDLRSDAKGLTDGMVATRICGVGGGRGEGSWEMRNNRGWGKERRGTYIGCVGRHDWMVV